MQPTLELFSDSRLVFSSAGKWLHPLFELEDFLAGAGSGLNPAGLSLRDKVAGKAAALMIVRLGIRRVHAGVLSRLGKQVFEAYQVEHTWDQLVDRIACQTETALARIDDPGEAYAWLQRRAGR
jgi:zinc transport system ATP-binding protein